MVTAVILTVIFLATAAFFYLKKRQSQQLAFIQSYTFHPVLSKKVKEKYPHLTGAEVAKVFDALRDYFTFCNQAKGRMVAMPSQVVDVAWHEFIIFTRAYEVFSRRAIGRFLHHTPTVAMESPTHAQEGIKRAWRLSCAWENIDPAAPKRLPLLFAIDALLDIEDGFRYSLDCTSKSSPNYGDGYCAAHIGCTSGCGGDSASATDSGGFFEGAGGSDCGGGCGGD